MDVALFIALIIFSMWKAFKLITASTAHFIEEYFDQNEPSDWDDLK